MTGIIGCRGKVLNIPGLSILGFAGGALQLHRLFHPDVLQTPRPKPALSNGAGEKSWLRNSVLEVGRRIQPDTRRACDGTLLKLSLLWDMVVQSLPATEA